MSKAKSLTELAKDLRERLGLKQIGMSQALGLGYSTIQNYEGRGPIPPQGLAKYAMAAFGAGHTDLGDAFKDAALNGVPAELVELVRYGREPPPLSEEHQMLDAILGDPKLAKDMRRYLKDHSGVAIERRKRAVAKPDQVEPGRKVS